jgi:hypothetical protein
MGFIGFRELFPSVPPNSVGEPKYPEFRRQYDTVPTYYSIVIVTVGADTSDSTSIFG